MTEEQIRVQVLQNQLGALLSQIIDLQVAFTLYREQNPIQVEKSE